jgi:hypothetical protein
MTTKGLAVMNNSQVVHKMTDDADATLGTATAETVSSLKAKTTIMGGASDLASDLNTLSGSTANKTGVAWKIQSSKNRASDIEGELLATANVLGADSPFGYTAEAVDTNYVNDASSFHNADEQLSTQLDTSSTTLVTLNSSDDTDVNSVDGMIRKYLKGGESGVVTYTMAQLEQALGDDAGLKTALDTRLALLESTIRGGAAGVNTAGLSGSVNNHETTTVANAAVLIGNRLDDMKGISGITGTDAASFAYAPSISDKDGSAETGITSVRDADEKLDVAGADMRRRKDDMVKVGISTQNLTVAGSTSFGGDVSFAPTTAGELAADASEMAVPVYTTVAQAKNAHAADETSNSCVFYLKVDSASFDPTADADFPANNKFYFNEAATGVWFPSPFHSEE